MEAASRPSLELLPDLPVEEPLDNAATRREPPAPPGAAAAETAAKPAPAARDPEQTGLNFVDPEMFLAPGQEPSAIPVAAAAASAKAAEPLELVLEDPVVDDMLSAPPAPAATAAAAAPAAPPLAPAAARSAPSQAARSATPANDATAASSEAARAAARVPIAKTGSLSAAATKLAAATAASRAKPAVPPIARPAVPAADKPAAAAAKAAAPTLASWAQARASAAKSATPPAAATAVAPGASAPPAPRATPAPAAAAAVRPSAPPKTAPPTSAPAGAAPAVPPAVPMDRDFIARNQVVERYLSGRLPLKGATDFERFCHDNPQLLDEIGLPERVNAGLRLLEASGKPEPWQEAPRPPWQKPQVTLALAAASLLLAVALVVVATGSAAKNHRIAALQKQASERALDPATSTREIRLLPSRSGASNSPAIIIGGGTTQLADFRIDESRSPYHAFRVTIDRIDQGRVAVLGNLAKDSNGHLRLALNSSALGPGNYQLTLEGLDWRGEPQPDSWVTIGIAR
jgi:hypothetical protein